MNKFEKEYINFLKETIWIDPATKEEIDDEGDPDSLTPAMKDKINRGKLVAKSPEPGATGDTPAAPPATPGYLDRLKRFGRRATTAAADAGRRATTAAADAFTDIANNPGNLATGLAKIGGYDARENAKQLEIRVNNISSLKKYISEPAEAPPEGSDESYFYKLIDVDTPSYNGFVEILHRLNPEAANRFVDAIRDLDSTKQNFIQIKSSIPGVDLRSTVLVGKIGENIYAYYLKPESGREGPGPVTTTAKTPQTSNTGATTP